MRAAYYKADEVPEYDPQEHWRGTQTINNERNQAKEKFMQEFGQRAMYEVRIRYVGKVDVAGKFTPIKPKIKRKRK